MFFRKKKLASLSYQDIMGGFLVLIVVLAILTTALVTAFNSWFFNGKESNPFIHADQQGNLLCDSLVQHATFYNEGRLNLNGYFLSTEVTYPTVRHFENAFEYKFKNCRDQIDEIANAWCDNYIALYEKEFMNRKEYRINDADYRACQTKIDNHVFKIDHKSFEMRKGRVNSVINLGGKWVSMLEIEIWEPESFTVHPGRKAYRQCVATNNYAYCIYRASEDDVRAIYRKLIDQSIN